MDLKIFNLKDGAGKEEVAAAYAELKKKYRDEMFYSEQGGAAAEKLEKLEAAYKEYNEQNLWGADIGAVLARAAELVKKNALDEAQGILDKISPRTAEWHFYQAMLYYQKNWYAESKKQLELALQLEPGNKKYKENYQSLLAFSAAPQPPPDAPAAPARPNDGDCCSPTSGSPAANCLGGCCFRDRDE